jgi:hypothetical protein
MRSIFKPVREEDALWEVGGHFINPPHTSSEQGFLKLKATETY